MPRASASRGATQLNARIDQAPDWLAARQRPLMTRCTAVPKRSARGAFAWRPTLALHVPEYSVPLPETVARQWPVHSADAFVADHPPRATVLRCASRSVHVPVTWPVFESAVAVHVPISVRPVVLVALHVFARALLASCCETASCAPNVAASNSRMRNRFCTAPPRNLRVPHPRATAHRESCPAVATCWPSTTSRRRQAVCARAGAPVVRRSSPARWRRPQRGTVPRGGGLVNPPSLFRSSTKSSPKEKSARHALPTRTR
jgi:hypothetical protein